MPTGFPRVVVYDPWASCHITAVVRRDKGYVTYWCADHGTEERFPLDHVARVRDALETTEGLQVVSWIEVTDDGC